MKRLEMAIEKAFMWLFAVLGLVALVAAVLGARHQWLVAVICGVMVMVQRYEIKEAAKRD